jgi:hypothetical protein
MFHRICFSQQRMQVITTALLMTALVACTPSTPPTTGEVKGTILDFSGQPTVGGSVSLLMMEGAENEPQQGPGEELPGATIVETGAFLIRDVPPGKYALAVYASTGGFMTLSDEQGNALAFDVAAGQVADLGRLAVTTISGRPAIIKQP